MKAKIEKFNSQNISNEENLLANTKFDFTSVAQPKTRYNNEQKW